MNRLKIVYIIPGYRHSSKNKAYKEIAKILKKEGFIPRFINIPWKQTTISENTEHFLKKYKRIHSKNKYILGFSFGAMIAILASTKVDTKGLILCSLSPYFKEDIKKREKKLALNKFEDFRKLDFATLVKKIKTKEIHMLYGSREDRMVKKRAGETFARTKVEKKNLLQIGKTDHSIGDRNYLSAIEFVAKTLN